MRKIKLFIVVLVCVLGNCSIYSVPIPNEVVSCCDAPRDMFITMTTKQVDINLSVLKSSLLCIDWGDGIISCHFEEVSQTTQFKIGHFFYLVEMPRTITIYGVITSLNTNNIGLISIDVTNAPSLALLSIDNNNLASLDVSKNPLLHLLSFSRNKIDSLDLTYNQQLVMIDCRHNNFSANALNSLFHSLHANPPNNTHCRGRIRKTILIGGNPGTRDSERRIARQKGWGVENTR